MRPTLNLAIATLLLAEAPSLAAQSSTPVGKVRVTQASDLPAHTFTIQGKPSEVAQDGAAVLSLATALEKTLRRDLETCDIQNPALLLGIHTNLYMIAVLKQDLAEAQKQGDQVRALTEDTMRRAFAGLLVDPWVAARANPGADFRATYRARLSERLAKLPFNAFQGALTFSLSSIKPLTKAALLTGLEKGLDPQVKDGRLNQEMAEALLGTAYRLALHVAMRDDIVACLEALIESHKHDAPVKFTAVIGTPKAPAQGPWFGQPLPGEKPERFAADFLSAINPWAEGPAFSPDGQTCFIAIGDATYSGARTFQSTCVEGTWTPFVEPSALADFLDTGETEFSPDGQSLVFTGKQAGRSRDLYRMPRTVTGWGAPVAMAPAISSDQEEFRGSFTRDGTLYFGRNKGGKMEIHKAVKDATGKTLVEKLGAPLNGTTVDGDPCIAPDGRWMVFYSGRSGGVDLWVSFADGKGGWGEPVHMGPEVNSPHDEYGAHLLADGKFLFCSRHTPKGNETWWMKSSAIDRLKR